MQSILCLWCVIKQWIRLSVSLFLDALRFLVLQFLTVCRLKLAFKWFIPQLTLRILEFSWRDRITAASRFRVYLRGCIGPLGASIVLGEAWILRPELFLFDLFVRHTLITALQFIRRSMQGLSTCPGWCWILAWGSLQTLRNMHQCLCIGQDLALWAVIITGCILHWSCFIRS